MKGTLDRFRVLLLTALCLSLPNEFACADVVTDWNALALQAIQATNTPPPAAARVLAMTQLAIFDAVNAVDQTYQPYFSPPPLLPPKYRARLPRR